MIPISEFFLSQDSKIVTGETRETVKEDSVPLSRVKKEELELTYSANPMIFNSINKYVQTILSGSNNLVGKDKKAVSDLRDFISKLGENGADTTWKELLTLIFRHQFIYGSAWVENIYNKRGNMIVDWDIIDPKKMDYARDSEGRVVLDGNQKPVGYFQIFKNSKSKLGASEKSKILPKGVVRPSNGYSVFLRPEQVCHFKLFTVGDGLDPIGLIEPIYKTSLRKLNIEEALANAIYRHGFPIVWAKLGDMNHEPTPQQIQNMLEKLKNINFKQEIATPYYYDLQILESKKSEKLREHLEYFKEQEITGIGLPQPIATGSTEGGSYASLAKQSEIFNIALNDIIEKTCVQIEKQMFSPYCNARGCTEVPKLNISISNQDKLTQKAKRIVEYVKSGVLAGNNPNVTSFVQSTEFGDNEK